MLKDAEQKRILKNSGLKVTLSRLKILDVLSLPENKHINADDLYKALLSLGENIGLATVYRVLSQFEKEGMVVRHNFEGSKSVFELTTQHHHDHLICLGCGKVIEFTDEVIEKRQREIAREHNLNLVHHSMYLYGRCIDGEHGQIQSELEK